MRNTSRAAGARLAVAAVVFAAGVAARAQQPATSAESAATPVVADGVFVDGQGREIGQVRARQTPHGVILRIDLTNGTPGVHALHVHEVGRCEPPSFDSAGDHLDPGAHPRQHGFLNPEGPHAGDLPNVEIPATSKLAVEFMLPTVTLEPGPRALLDADGAALVIHEGKDDYASDPAGQSGDRLACAVLGAAPGASRGASPTSR